jgi:hypothetical protein
LRERRPDDVHVDLRADGPEGLGTAAVGDARREALLVRRR